MPVRVTVWGENVHEREEERGPRALSRRDARDDRREPRRAARRPRVRSAPRRSSSRARADGRGAAQTDVLTWWGHHAHDQVDDAVVERVHEAVLGGMGLLALHSAHYSKIFLRLLGTSCSLQWRNAGERELVWTVDPAHPIAAGVPQPIVIDAQEMYGEPSTSRRRTSSSSSRRSCGRRGLPRRLLLPPRPRPDLLLQPRRPGLPRLPPPRRAAGAGQRGPLGAPAAPTRTAAPPAR